MMGNYHVRFLGGEGAAMPPSYPIEYQHSSKPCSLWVSQMQPWPFIDKKNKTLQAGKSVLPERKIVTTKRTLETAFTSWQIRSAGAQVRNHKADAGNRVYKRARPFRRSVNS
jgi:hypothetical protein